jgi:ubiquitin C-terminal hydrolase
MVETRISRAPDILIVHLKRFSYQNGYLEKIEDLVNFPVNNLDVSSFLCSGFRKHHASKGSSRKAGRAGVGASSKNHTYDLYAVVNHIMYHNTGGGHYTSYISTNP